ncbi:MAG: DUF3291 domain-containing protein [Actinomycetota bacterium]
MDGSHVAQVNVARLLAPLDSPQLAQFVANLEPVNAIADTSPGFIWRLQTADGDATSVRVLDDDWLIVNLSVWESLDALRDYVFRTRHAEVLKRRHEWFERMRDAHLAVWWIDRGTVPTVEDAVDRLLLLRRVGPSPDAFTLKEPFPSP